MDQSERSSALYRTTSFGEVKTGAIFYHSTALSNNFYAKYHVSRRAYHGLIRPRHAAVLNDIEWSRDNLMNVNCKDKRNVIKAANRTEIDQLIVDGNIIARFSTFNCLYSLQVVSNLKWNSHVDYIHAKASSRLYFWKQLNKCSNNIGDMLHFYTTVIRRVLEYACPV